MRIWLSWHVPGWPISTRANAASTRSIPYPAKTFRRKVESSRRRLRSARFDAAILLPNSFDSALTMWMAGIPERIGYKRDARGMLLTRAIPVPEPGDIPRHERFYYLELLRRAGMLERFPDDRAYRVGWHRGPRVRPAHRNWPRSVLRRP